MIRGLIIFFLSLLSIGASSVKSAKRETAVPLGSQLAAVVAAPMVVIDAGHGGTDLGAKARPPYCEEKKISLQTARLVKKYLNQLGYRVVMTRDTDAFVSLPRRVEIASQADGDLFVSIHFNSTRNQTVKGIEVFFSENGDQRSRVSSSRQLADAVLSRVIDRTRAVSRGVKRGNFFVIRETSMPSILVEGGFISNTEERALLRSRDYQDKIARGIANGIDAYFKKRKI